MRQCHWPTSAVVPRKAQACRVTRCTAARLSSRLPWAIAVLTVVLNITMGPGAFAHALRKQDHHDELHRHTTRAPPPPQQALLEERLRGIDGQAVSGRHEAVHSSESASDDGDQYDLVQPYVLDEAAVTGRVSQEEQADFDAEYDAEEWEAAGGTAAGSVRLGWGSAAGVSGGSARRLLQPSLGVMRPDKRKPSKYTECNRCLILRCGKHGACSGQCRKGRTLYRCIGLVSRKTCTRGDQPWRTRPDLLAPDRLGPLSSVVVTTRDPFIGCANITGLPTGCPGPSTPGAESLEYNIVGSYCVQHQPVIHECESPFYPFGYCMCQFLDNRLGDVHERPCESSNEGMFLRLDEATTPAVDGGPDVLLSDQRVYLDTDYTNSTTTFHDYAHASETEGATYSYSHVWPRVRYRSLHVQLDFFHTFYTRSYNFTDLGAKVLPEYEDDPATLAYEELVEDYYFVSRYWDGTDRLDPHLQCWYKCQFEGGDYVLGNGIPRSGLTVLFEDRFDCSYCFSDRAAPVGQNDVYRYAYYGAGDYADYD